VKLPPELLVRLLRAIQTMGYLTLSDSDTTVQLTELGTYLRKDHPNGSYYCVRHIEELYQPWWYLPEALRTGKEQASKVYNQNLWEYYETHQDSADCFTRCMKSIFTPVANVLPFDYDFGGVSHLVDAGGGMGQMTLSIAKAYPGIKKATIFDLASVIKNAPSPSPDPRVSWAVGSFFDTATIPKGADCYMLIGVIHDWDDEDSIKILSNIREAMKENKNAKILLMDGVSERGAMEDFGTIQDLSMLTVLGGIWRTREHYAEIGKKSGLVVTGQFATRSMISIFEMKDAGK